MGYETETYAKPGDYVITNHTRLREQYVIAKEKFEKAYAKNDDDTFSKHEKIKAIIVSDQLFETIKEKYSVKPFERETNKGRKLEFIYLESPWGDSQVLFANDYLIIGDSEVYRVDNTEFEESYKEV